MPEILHQPELAIGDEVGVTIEYLSAAEGARIMAEAPVVPTVPPRWGELWTLFKWRFVFDFNRLLSWVRTKWR